MKFHSILSAVALAAAALGSAAPAGAATIVLAPTGPGSFATTFTQAANGLVIDDFSFAPLASATNFSVTLSSLAGPVTFFDAVFFPDTPAEIDFPNLTNVVGGMFSVSTQVAAGTPLTLRVFGAVTDPSGNLGGDGAYQVAVLAAVPEATTTALLAVGLLAVALAARRRRG